MKRILPPAKPLFTQKTGLPVYMRPVFMLLLLLGFYSASAQVVLYVDDVNGNDAYTGTSWPQAFKTVSMALNTARLNTAVDSILVAQGTYYPTGAQNGTNRDSSFVIIRGKLKVYGGYPNGGGTRDIAANPAILSGDIGNLNDTIDNSYHVMVIGGIASTDDSIVVDGFTITKGNANAGATIFYGSTPVYQGHGGGMYVKNNATAQKTALRNITFTSNTSNILAGALEIDISSPYIQNCLFTNNHCISYGGALANDNQSSPYVTGSSFTGNTANVYGGAVYTQNSTSYPSFINCSFTGNNAIPLAPSTSWTFGGAMFNNNGSTTTITNCIFTANRSTGGGGAVCGNNATTTITYSVFDSNVCLNAAGNIGTGGALQINGSSGIFNVTNTVLVNNIGGGTADDGGGGIMAYSGTFNLVNVTLWGNTTQSTIKPNSNGISVYAGATVNFSNGIAWGGSTAQQVHNLGTLNYNYSLVQGITAALPNLNIDPQFVNAGNPLGADGIWGTADDGLHLTNCSPAVNMGSDALVPGGISTDMAGNARIFGLAVDMGAYEFQSAIATISFTNVVKTYGDADAAVPNITNCSGLPLTYTIADNSIATIVSGNLHVIKAGTTTITAHTINGAPDVTVTLTVNPKPVTLSLTATSISKVYDGNTNATISTGNLQFAPGDVVGADDVAIVLSSTTAFYDTKDAGSGKTVTVPLANINLTGTTAANYIISNTTDITAAIGIITPLAITITADPQSKVYGDADPALTYAYTPALIAGDAFTGSLIRVPGENIGSWPINEGTLTAGSNYTITYNTDNLTITPKTITITADAQTKGYGEADPVLTYTFTPALVAGDAFTGSLDRIPGENIGTYSINQGMLSLSSNYMIAYNSNNLTITAKTITVSVDAQAKTYGDTDPALTYTYSPALVGSDVFTGTLGRIPGENAGAYAIVQNTLALSNNYVINYVPASLVINKAVLTVTAADETVCLNKTISSIPVSYTGFKFSDDASSINTAPAVNIPSWNTAGTYELSPYGGSANNYIFNYVNGELTVLAIPTGNIAQVPIGPGIITTPNATSGMQLYAPMGLGYSYTWSTGEAGSSIVVKSSGNYWVTVTNTDGCSATFNITVKQQTLIIPNIFSPNGDGIHDRWVIENLENYPGNVVQIYNRYGQVVYKTVNFTTWDGKVNGNDMPVGTYYYIVDLKNGQKPVTGFIDIIR